MLLKFLLTSLLHSAFFTDILKHKTVNKTTCITLNKFSPTMCTLVQELSDCYDYF